MYNQTINIFKKSFVYKFKLKISAHIRVQNEIEIDCA